MKVAMGRILPKPLEHVLFLKTQKEIMENLYPIFSPQSYKCIFFVVFILTQLHTHTHPQKAKTKLFYKFITTTTATFCVIYIMYYLLLYKKATTGNIYYCYTKK